MGWWGLGGVGWGWWFFGWFLAIASGRCWQRKWQTPPKILIFYHCTKAHAHAVLESEIKEKKITIGYVYNLTIRIMDFTFFRTYRYVQHSTTLLLHGIYNLQQPSSLQLDLFRSVLFEQCCNFGVTSFDSYFQWCPSFELFVNINLLVC